MNKKLIVFVGLISFLLAALVWVQRGSISVVKASPDIYQGDLVIQGNNVTIIEGRFDINGSIIVEDNATLVVRNATINLFQTATYDHRILFGKLMVGGTPRLQATNSTITSNGSLPMSFIGSSRLTAFRLNISDGVFLSVDDTAICTLSSCVIDDYVHINNNYHNVAISNSEIKGLQTMSSSNVSIFNSTIRKINIDTEMADFSLIGIKPGFFDFWSFRLNCSVTLDAYGRAANVTLINTQIGSFGFSGYWSRVTAVNSVIGGLWVSEPGAGPDASAHVADCSISWLYAADSSCVWLTNSTYDNCNLQHSAKVYVNWYLDVHVVDLNGTDVPSASVTATYPNATFAESKLTNANGLARLSLIEKMKNATGEYAIGNYTIEATYETHSNSQTVNITENKQTTLALPFIIPEFPSILLIPLFMIATLLAVIAYKRKHAQTTAFKRLGEYLTSKSRKKGSVRETSPLYEKKARL